MPDQAMSSMGEYRRGASKAARALAILTMGIGAAGSVAGEAGPTTRDATPFSLPMSTDTLDEPAEALPLDLTTALDSKAGTGSWYVRLDRGGQVTVLTLALPVVALVLCAILRVLSRWRQLRKRPRCFAGCQTTIDADNRSSERLRLPVTVSTAIPAPGQQRSSSRQLSQPSEAALRADDAPVLIVAGDLLVDCNRSALDLFRTTREQLLRGRFADICPPHEQEGASSESAAGPLLEGALGGAPQEFGWRCRRQNGEMFEAHISLERITRYGQWVIRTRIVDLSDQKREAQIPRTDSSPQALSADRESRELLQATVDLAEFIRESSRTISQSLAATGSEEDIVRLPIEEAEASRAVETESDKARTKGPAGRASTRRTTEDL